MKYYKQTDIPTNQPARNSYPLARTNLFAGVLLALVLSTSPSYAGSFGSALSFDGLDATTAGGDYVSLPAFTTNLLPPYTFEAWLKPNGSQAGWAGIVGSRNSGKYLGLWADAQNYCQCWDMAFACPASNQLTSNVWQHVAVVFLTNSQTLLVNGASVANFTSTLSSYSTSGDIFNIGYDSYLSTGSRTYKGLIDEVRLWNVDKSADIATKSYRCSPLSGSPIGLLRYYKFDENSGTSANDSTSGSVAGSLRNSTSNSPAADGVTTGPLWVTSTLDTEPTSPCLPTAPTNLVVTAVSPSQITLSWTDNSDDETSFKIESPIGTLLTTTAANTTYYMQTGLTCNTSYTYSVKATNVFGDSTAITGSGTTFSCSTTSTSFGSALSFDGLDATTAGGDYVSLPPFTTNLSPPYTIEAWLKPNGSQAGWAGIVGGRNSGNYLGLWANVQNYCQGWNMASACPASNQLTSNVWQHVAVVFQPNSQTLLVNGTNVATFANTLSLYNTSGDLFNIGYDSYFGTGNRTYKGLIDEVRLWNVDKSADIATKSYRCSPLSGSPIGLLRYYKFDENSGTSANDSTSGSVAGSLRNSTSNSPAADGVTTGPLWVTSTLDTEPTSPCLPTAPTNLVVTAVSPSQITLSWTDNSDDETSFKIESPIGTLLTTTAANTTYYMQPGLACNTSYTYSVKATNVFGDSTAITGRGTTPPCVTPVIPPPTYQLQLQVVGTGLGQLVSNYPLGLDCSSATQPCSYTITGATWIDFTVTPNPGSELTGWSGESNCGNGGNQVLVTHDTICTVTFGLKSYQLTANFLGRGHVTGSKINCPGQCTATYPYGTMVTLKAQTPRWMWNFSGWRGCDSQGTLQITNDVLCQAVFTPDPNIPNAGDGNGDGLPDAYQDNVVSLPDKVTGTYLTLEALPTTCVISDIYPDLAEAQTIKLDHTKKFPQGMLYFDIACPQAQVSVYYHGMSKLSRNLKFYKFGPKIPGDLTTLAWYPLPNIKYEVVTIGGKPVVKGTYTLTDGALGDSTGVDGHIIDPIGLTGVE